MNSKGVTPVVAVVLLMVISVAAAGTAYTFIIGTQQTAQEGFEENINQRQIQERTDIEIENVYENSDGDALLIVRNTGSLSQIVEENNNKYWALYVDGSQVGAGGTGWEYVQNSYKSQADVNLNPQDTLPINSTKQFPSPGSSKEFRIVGRYGSEATIICEGNPDGIC